MGRETHYLIHWKNMRDKYWAKKTYGRVDPIEYEEKRFSTPAGKLIDRIEKQAVVDLLKKYISDEEKIEILDVASGTGRLAFYIEEHIKEADIIGVDINENMLSRAKKIATNKKSKVNFLIGDIYSLPFTNNYFDAVVGLRFSMHLANLDIVLKELSRVLKKDGLLIFDIFNYNSILRLRGKDGYYTLSDLLGYGQNCSLRFLSCKGILLLGETIIRKLPSILLQMYNPLAQPPNLLEKYSTKLTVCFKKI